MKFTIFNRQVDAEAQSWCIFNISALWHVPCNFAYVTRSLVALNIKNNCDHVALDRARTKATTGLLLQELHFNARICALETQHVVLILFCFSVSQSFIIMFTLRIFFSFNFLFRRTLSINDGFCLISDASLNLYSNHKFLLIFVSSRFSFFFFKLVVTFQNIPKWVCNPFFNPFGCYLHSNMSVNEAKIIQSRGTKIKGWDDVINPLQFSFALCILTQHEKKVGEQKSKKNSLNMKRV